ncbi:hypothetical protein [Paraburkholderia lycopersici]|uniref:hypothetical protein n=1 Tax=Paraburkholderia lycopersici TaxID=416944 RepID=UPI001160F845|nr:hypothetical protein [Paraburkholderia lycopersici]
MLKRNITPQEFVQGQKGASRTVSQRIRSTRRTGDSIASGRRVMQRLKFGGKGKVQMKQKSEAVKAAPKLAKGGGNTFSALAKKAKKRRCSRWMK